MKLLKSWHKVLESELIDIASDVKEIVATPALIILTGDVGAGKTTFSKVFVEEQGVLSPTYSLINEFDNVTHADLYRIESSKEIMHLEIPLYMEDKQYFLVEWGKPYLNEVIQELEDEFVAHELIVEIVGERRDFHLYQL